MGLLNRGARLPADVTSALGVGARERVVAWGTGPSTRPGERAHVVATDRALYLEGSNERVPWDRITKATWDEPDLDLVISGPPTRRLRLTLDDARDLPPAVHDRVTASVVVSERLDLGEGRGAKAVARRASDDDEIRWSVVFDSGLDPTDPDLRAAADEALTRLRDSLGV